MELSDPILFRVDLPQMTEVIIAIVILAFLVERALSVIFESRIFIDNTEDGEILDNIRKANNLPSDDNVRKKKKKRGIKELISFAVSLAICIVWQFDAVSIIMKSESVNYFGFIVTGGIIAGGSKGAMLLFKDWLKIMSSAEKARIAAQNAGK
jgi:hypothetical protein